MLTNKQTKKLTKAISQFTGDKRDNLVLIPQGLEPPGALYLLLKDYYHTMGVPILKGRISLGIDPSNLDKAQAIIGKSHFSPRLDETMAFLCPKLRELKGKAVKLRKKPANVKDDFLVDPNLPYGWFTYKFNDTPFCPEFIVWHRTADDIVLCQIFSEALPYSTVEVCLPRSMDGSYKHRKLMQIALD